LLEEIAQRLQNLRQRFRAQLRRSTGAGGHAGQPDFPARPGLRLAAILGGPFAHATFLLPGGL
jgi:hypothetical protein